MRLGGLFEPELARTLDPTTTIRSRSQSAAVIMLVAPWFSGAAVLLSPGSPSTAADTVLVIMSLSCVGLGALMYRFPTLIPFVLIPPLGAILMGVYGYLGRGDVPVATGGMFATLAVMVAMFFPTGQAFSINLFVAACVICSELSRGPLYVALAAALPTIGWVGSGTVVVSSLRETVNELFARLNRQSRHDDLTGVPNRLAFLETGRRLLEERPFESKVGFLLVDLDRFKEINDTLGHGYGDLLLISVAQRLGAQLRASDVVARLGGDEFALLLPGLSDRSDATKLAAQLVRVLNDPFMIEGTPITIGASIGVALAPDDGQSTTELLQAADLAMYEAKVTRVGFLDGTSVTSRAPANVLLLGELKDAIIGNELVLHYQPKLSVRTGALTGCEALVRWQHRTRGIIAPNDFTPIAERTGLIHQLTLWVLDEAIHQASMWHGSGAPLVVSVNISTRSLLDRHFVSNVRDRLRTYRLPAELLCLEVTEGTFMSDPEAACGVLVELRSLGVQISIDDFGTGYSSLAYLRSIPANELKIDRTFIADLGAAGTNVAIVDATLHLAHSLGLSVVAEGVEDPEALAVLARLGCDEAQGFWFSRPLPNDAFERWRDNYALTRPHQSAEVSLTA